MQSMPRWASNTLNRSSRAFTYPLLGPLFLRTSSYAHECPSRVQVLQLGLTPSHFSFLLRHIMHARRFGLGTLVLSPSWAVTCGTWSAVPESVVMASGEDAECGDIELSFSANWIDGVSLVTMGIGFEIEQGRESVVVCASMLTLAGRRASKDLM
jgi:hypothetical protein